MGSSLCIPHNVLRNITNPTEFVHQHTGGKNKTPENYTRVLRDQNESVSSKTLRTEKRRLTYRSTFQSASTDEA